MATVNTIAGHVGRLATSIGDTARKRVMTAGANAGVKAADKAPKSDLGPDGAFSGWTRAKPIVLRTQSNVDVQASKITISRDRRSAGPWRVAQDGRHSDGGVGLFQGPSVNLRTGRTSRRNDGTLRIARARAGRRAKRWNGRTAGKGTWTKAETAVRAETPKAMWKAQKDEIRRVIRG